MEIRPEIGWLRAYEKVLLDLSHPDLADHGVEWSPASHSAVFCLSPVHSTVDLSKIIVGVWSHTAEVTRPL